jgi:hypothetical protein
MIGVVAALVATAGDLMLLATSNAGRPGLEWLGPPSETVLLLGTYLGALAIPCYGLGYRAVARRIDAPQARTIAALGVAGGVVGGTIHALTGLAIHVESMHDGGSVDPITMLGRYGAYLGPLWALVAALTIAGSVLFALVVARGRSTLPRWSALANPALLTLGFALLGATSDVGRAFVVPAAPNLAHVVFFALAAALRPDAAASPFDQGGAARSRTR